MHSHHIRTDKQLKSISILIDFARTTGTCLHTLFLHSIVSDVGYSVSKSINIACSWGEWYASGMLCVCESEIWMIAHANAGDIKHFIWWSHIIDEIGHAWSFAAHSMRLHILHGPSNVCAKQKAKFTHFASDWIKTAPAEKKAPQEAMTSAFFLNQREPGEIVVKKKRFLFLLFFVSLWITEICVCFFLLSRYCYCCCLATADLRSPLKHDTRLMQYNFITLWNSQMMNDHRIRG